MSDSLEKLKKAFASSEQKVKAIEEKPGVANVAMVTSIKAQFYERVRPLLEEE